MLELTTTGTSMNAKHARSMDLQAEKLIKVHEAYSDVLHCITALQCPALKVYSSVETGSGHPGQPGQ